MVTPVSIHVCGSVNLDLVTTCARLPEAGETVLGGAFAKHPGGKGANQALAARRLGAEVRLIARTGDDAEAEAALALLRADGADLSLCRAVQGETTGVALIAVDASGDNQIVVAPGANATLTIADLPGTIEGALIGQLEVPAAVLDAAAQRCTGLVVINLAPAGPVPESLIARADLLVVNETEAAVYGRDRLLAAGGRVAITLGARGAVLFEDGVEIARAAPPKVDVVDATGAGDAFTGAITVALIEDMAPDRALAFACAAAAASTTRPGAQTALPRRAEVDALLDARS
ncbi:MAG: ribokinase [Oceanicaulis sp.]